MKNKYKFVQLELKKLGFYSEEIDGLIGPKTEKALHKAKNYWPPFWNPQRKAIGYIQYLAQQKHLNIGSIDGICGPKTEKAYILLRNKEKNDIEKNPSHFYKWPHEDNESLINFYGSPGSNTTYLKLPYPMVLSWDLDVSITKFSCHKLCHGSLEYIFEKTLGYYGLDEIKKLDLDKFGGCSNVRKIRGGNRWSTHAFSCAVDLSPNKNQLRWGKDKSQFAKSEYEEFWKIVEEVGGYSLGRKHNYDFQHFQFAWRK